MYTFLITDTSRSHALPKEPDISDHTSDPTSGDDGPVPEISSDSDCRKDFEPPHVEGQHVVVSQPHVEGHVVVSQTIGAEESMDSVVEDDWVNLSSSTHPLVTSND